MTANEIYELARARKPMPDFLTLPEQMLYSIARNLYKSYADGIISAEQAKQEKLNSIRNFESVNAWYEIYKDFGRRRLKISALTIEAEKNGCDICKGISRVFDGREIVYDEEEQDE